MEKQCELKRQCNGRKNEKKKKKSHCKLCVVKDLTVEKEKMVTAFTSLMVVLPWTTAPLLYLSNAVHLNITLIVHIIL